MLSSVYGGISLYHEDKKNHVKKSNNGAVEGNSGRSLAGGTQGQGEISREESELVRWGAKLIPGGQKLPWFSPWVGCFQC